MADDNVSDPGRVCTKCGQCKPADLTHFRYEAKTRLGLTSICRECERENRRARRAADPGYDKRYYEANKDWLLPKMNERKRERRKNNPGEVLEVQRKWRDENRDKYRQYQRAYYARNPEKECERIRLYYERNPDKKRKLNEKREQWRRDNREKARAIVRKRRAIKHNAEGHHTAEDVERQKAGQKGRCWWCNCKLTGQDYHVDHRIPLSRGGDDGPDNIVVTCRECNQKKNSKMPWEMNNPRLV